MTTQEGIGCLNERQVCREAAEERRAILDWITPFDYVSQQYGFINRRQANTGQWFLDSNIYQAWLNAKKQTLFCPGIPGAGKTVLTSIVVNDICQRYRDDHAVGVGYIYCNPKRQDVQRISDLLASLLRQLAEGQSPLSKPVVDLYGLHKRKQTRPLLEEISKILHSVAVSYSKIFILVDVLDECEDVNGCRTRFLSEIFTIQEKCNLHFLATARFIPGISQ